MDLKRNCNIPIALQRNYSKDKAVENEVHLDSGKHESSCFATQRGLVAIVVSAIRISHTVLVQRFHKVEDCHLFTRILS